MRRQKITLLLLLSFVFGALFPVNFRSKPPTIPQDKKLFYSDYIQSKDWKRKRRLRLKIDKGRCRGGHIFPVKTNLHIHHKTYKRLGNESVKRDLITLCNKCHKRAHKQWVKK